MKINIYNAYNFKDIEKLPGQCLDVRQHTAVHDNLEIINTIIGEYDVKRYSTPYQYISGTFDNIRIAYENDMILYPEIGLNGRQFKSFAEEVIRFCRKQNKTTINLYTEHQLMVDAFRLAVRQNKIEVDEISFYYIDEYEIKRELKHECNGKLEFPKDYMCSVEDVLMELM